MAKDDAPAPDRPPAKRRALEQCPDQWLAVWAGSEALSPSERRRAQDERDRRKQARARTERRVGVIVTREGATRQQVECLRELLERHQPTEVHHHGVQRSVHTACKASSPSVIQHRDDPRTVILNAQSVIVLVKSMDERSEAWALARYASHRRLGIEIVTQDGGVLTGIPQTHDRRAAPNMLRI